MFVVLPRPTPSLQEAEHLLWQDVEQTRIEFVKQILSNYGKAIAGVEVGYSILVLTPLRKFHTRSPLA